MVAKVKGTKKPRQTMAEYRAKKQADFDAAEFPDSAPKLTEVQKWQLKLKEEREARELARKNRKPKPARCGKKSIVLMTELCERIAGGESMYRVCEDHHMPNRAAIFHWIKDDPIFAELLREAYAARGEKFAEETTLLADEAKEAPPELTAAYRLAVDTRKWVASRLLPKKYGDKVALVGDSENPVAVQHVAASNELLKKIRGEDSE